MVVSVRSIVTAGLMAVGLSLGGHAQACTGGGALIGPYSLLVGGTTFASGGKFLAGVLSFNGQCGLTGTLSGGRNGGQTEFASVTGSYGLNSDGSINVTLQNVPGSSGPEVYSASYSQTAHELLGVETDGSAVASADFQQQSSFLLNLFGYNTGSLVGTYSTVCTGTGVGYSDLNRVTFDGRGNLSGYDYFDDGGTVGLGVPYTGTVAVTNQGVFGGALQGAFNVFTFAGALSNNANEIQFVYFQTGAGTITMCTGKR